MAVVMQTEDFPYLPSGPAEVNKMIKEHGDLFSDSQCKVCSAVLISESQKLTHYQSKKHANKVRRYLSIQNEKEPALKKLKSSSSDSDCNNGDTDRSKVCHVCNMTFSSPVVAESHYQGKVHAKNLRLKTVGPQTPAVASQTIPTAQPKKKPADDLSAVPATGNNDNNNPDRFCSICQASFNNPLMAQQHYVGKKHRKQMTKLKLMETYGPSTAPASTLKGYPCTICNIELNSVEQYQSHISGAKHKNQMKKSGLNTAENQHTAEQSYGSDNQYAGRDNQYTAADNQYAPGDDQYTAGDNQYTPEDTEYSEEYQYT
ncbi:zinc finger protein 346 isoform X2 [Toxotes jaculatrix]|uniref:zinc finger protein 346 isoform X2 n=1 Tax=Toxotes jaculatrix TaxID=941984 RepID=UPI001B3AEAE5|nr:zinc finger protein 346 isoform X2 [Toxotes jaculatrix]